MKIIRNTTSISEIYDQLKNGNLTINRSYQRSNGLWPDNARSYFVDTILNDFPFPKIIIRQMVDLKTKKTRREIIDGQQRLLTIRDFIDNKIRLTKVSKKYFGYYYNDLDEAEQNKLLSYEISSDNVISGSEEEILEIFRRINSYTLPLSKTEQRHATYQGEFKWFISELAEYFSPFLENYKILTIRQLSRMEDADLIAELALLINEGITTRSMAKLENIYKENNVEFPFKDEMHRQLVETLEFIKTNLTEFFETYKIPAYNFYSIVGALIYNKFGFPTRDNEQFTKLLPIKKFCNNLEKSKSKLFEVFEDVEQKNINTSNKDFVLASLSTTHSVSNRSTRIKTLVDIFRID